MQPPEIIRSRANAVLRRMRRLKQRSGDGDLMLLEGPRLLREALAARVEFTEVLASPRADEVPAARLALNELADAGVPVRLVEAGLLDEFSEVETTQGVLALARRPRLDAGAALSGKAPLVLVAISVQNPGNLGGLLRTAEAAFATGALLVAGCADPFSAKALRGSMGSAFRLPLGIELQLDAALDQLRARGLALVAATGTAADPYTSMDWARPTALLVGNEGRGLPDDLLARVDQRVCIPMAHGVESLNVGVAAGVLLFEAARQRQ